jgi:hypothetical protein
MRTARSSGHWLKWSLSTSFDMYCSWHSGCLPTLLAVVVLAEIMEIASISLESRHVQISAFWTGIPLSHCQRRYGDLLPRQTRPRFSSKLATFRVPVRLVAQSAKQHVHFVGIGGAGLSALARLALSQVRTPSLDAGNLHTCGAALRCRVKC